VITISARVQYACLAAMELARRSGNGRPTRIDEIAEAQRIPKQFLVHILLQLKRDGILHSTRGVGGGYALARSPSTITVGDLVRAVEPTLALPEPKAGSRDETAGSDSVLFSLWRDVERQALGVIETMTVDDLLKRTDEAAEPAT
jgi:Rrf2 family protein